MSEQGIANTDRELWREREGDYYADSIHVTEQGGIGIDCGGTVIVKPLREWHALATPPVPAGEVGELVERVARAICAASGETWRTGTYEVASGRNFEVEDHPLDPFNNHWRHKARAAIAALSSPSSLR